MPNNEDVFLTPLGIAAVSAYEMFKALQEGGFTETQALKLVAEVLSNA